MNTLDIIALVSATLGLISSIYMSIITNTEVKRRKQKLKITEEQLQSCMQKVRE